MNIGHMDILGNHIINAILGAAQAAGHGVAQEAGNFAHDTWYGKVPGAGLNAVPGEFWNMIDPRHPENIPGDISMFFGARSGGFEQRGAEYEPLHPVEGQMRSEKVTKSFIKKVGNPNHAPQVRDPYNAHEAAIGGRMTHPGADWTNHSEMSDLINGARSASDAREVEPVPHDALSHGQSLVQDTAGPRYPHQVHDDQSFLQGHSEYPIRDATPKELVQKHFPNARYRGSKDSKPYGPAQAAILQQLMKEMRYNHRGMGN